MSHPDFSERIPEGLQLNFYLTVFEDISQKYWYSSNGSLWMRIRKREIYHRKYFEVFIAKRSYPKTQHFISKRRENQKKLILIRKLLFWWIFRTIFLTSSICFYSPEQKLGLCTNFCRLYPRSFKPVHDQRLPKS